MAPWQKALFALFAVAVVVAEGVLIERDLRFARDAEPVAAQIEGFFTRGGGRGQTRWAQLRFDDRGAEHIENAQLGLFCRPERGPTAALYNPKMKMPARIDTHLCRHSATDAAVLLVGAGLGAALIQWGRGRRATRA